MFRQLFKNALSGLLIGGAILSGCRSNTTDTGASNAVELRQTSVTPTFVSTIAPGVQAFTLISSDDTLRNSPNFVFGGMADGGIDNGFGDFTVSSSSGVPSLFVVTACHETVSDVSDALTLIEGGAAGVSESVVVGICRHEVVSETSANPTDVLKKSRRFIYEN